MAQLTLTSVQACQVEDARSGPKETEQFILSHRAVVRIVVRRTVVIPLFGVVYACAAELDPIRDMLGAWMCCDV